MGRVSTVAAIAAIVLLLTLMLRSSPDASAQHDSSAHAAIGRALRAHGIEGRDIATVAFFQENQHRWFERISASERRFSAYARVRESRLERCRVLQVRWRSYDSHAHGWHAWVIPRATHCMPLF